MPYGEDSFLSCGGDSSGYNRRTDLQSLSAGGQTSNVVFTGGKWILISSGILYLKVYLKRGDTYEKGI